MDNNHKLPNSIFHSETPSTDSLQESFLPHQETEAEIIFSPQMIENEAPKHAPVRLGGADLNGPSGRSVGDPEEEGMLMGPRHPAFNNRHTETPSHFNPPHPPPGARFDPINPVSPTGDPDFDDLLPPNPQDPLSKGIKPKPFHSHQHPSAPFGHPHGAPPGSGNPPFFM